MAAEEFLVCVLCIVAYYTATEVDPLDAAQLAGGGYSLPPAGTAKNVSIHWPISWGESGSKNLPSPSIENHCYTGYQGLKIMHITEKLFLFHMGDSYIVNK